MPSLFRRNYFPEPRFQARFLRFLMVGALSQAAITGSILGYFLRQNYVLLIKYGGLDTEIREILEREFLRLSFFMGCSFFVFLIGILVLGTIFSHRIAGVIFALKRTIRDNLSGKVTRLALRKSDEFQELCELFNQLVEGKSTRGSVSKTGS